MTELNFHLFFFHERTRAKVILQIIISHIFIPSCFNVSSFLWKRGVSSNSFNTLYDKSKLCIEKSKKIINQSMKINLTKIKGDFCTFAG